MKKDIILALVSAILGVIGGYFLLVVSEPKKEVSLRKTKIASQFEDYTNGRNEKTPFYSVHYFSFKNTGDTNLSKVEFEFAAEGGDAAYDENNERIQFLQRLSQSNKFGRHGFSTRKIGNTMYIRYDRFPVGAVDDIVISTDSIVDEFEVVASDPDINLVISSPDISFISTPFFIGQSGFSWLWLVGALMLGIALSYGAIFLRKRYA